MNRIDCETEKISSRTMGKIKKPINARPRASGKRNRPMVGLFFSIPLFILAITFLAAPESKVCKIMLQQDN